jgi:hypothetical protein
MDMELINHLELAAIWKLVWLRTGCGMTARLELAARMVTRLESLASASGACACVW